MPAMEREKLLQQSLIKTKYSKPETDSRLIPRSRLYDKLNQALANKLTVVCAPAGYGKTTAVNVWLKKSGIPSAWVSIDESDNDPVVFWKYIFAALDGIDKNISLDASYALSSQELLNSNVHLSIMIGRSSDAACDFVLVLDDFHHIRDGLILKNLSYLISFLPPKMHIIIISRTEPDLKLAAHGIKGGLIILRPNSLQFRQEEILEFYKARGFYLTSEEARKVERYTEGWAAALVAVAMSMGEAENRNKVMDRLASCNTHIFKYLQDEVISSWPEENLAFVMKTSVLDPLCGTLCDAVTGGENGHRLLAVISEKNGFLVSLDNDSNWYRYHSLFKEFLDKLLTGSNINKAELNLKAAVWCEHNGYPDKAIDYYLNAKRHDKAMALITRQIRELKRTGDYARVFAWIEKLPKELKECSFDVKAAYVLYYTETGLFDNAWECIKKMERLNAENKAARQIFNGENKSYIDMLKANLAIRQGNFEAFVSIIEKVSRVTKEKSIKMSGFLDCNLFDIYLCRSSMCMLVNLAREDLDRYRRFVENYRAMLSKNPGYAPLAEGEYYYESNMFQDALPCLLSAINEAIGAGCPGALIPAIASIARIKRAQGDIIGALHVVQEYEGWLEKQRKPHWIYMLNAFKTRLYIDSGDMEKVEKWFASCKLGIYHEISRVKEFELIVYARALMAKGLLNDADILLKRLLIFAEGKLRLHSEVEILNLLAVAAAGMGNEAYSMRYIEKALEIGSKEGYVRSFADEFAPVYELLKKYVIYREKQDTPAAYAEMLLGHAVKNANVTKTAKSGVSPHLINQLTPREDNVLQLLAAGLSNNEIARELGIALSTVKYHNINLFGKLEAKTRLEAVSKAKKLGLLD
jgi:LuxR family maltose regulon positive regulatory protein